MAVNLAQLQRLEAIEAALVKRAACVRQKIDDEFVSVTDEASADLRAGLPVIALYSRIYYLRDLMYETVVQFLNLIMLQSRG